MKKYIKKPISLLCAIFLALGPTKPLHSAFYPTLINALGATGTFMGGYFLGGYAGNARNYATNPTKGYALTVLSGCGLLTAVYGISRVVGATQQRAGLKKQGIDRSSIESPRHPPAGQAQYTNRTNLPTQDQHIDDIGVPQQKSSLKLQALCALSGIAAGYLLYKHKH